MKHVIFALVLFVTSLSVFAQRHPGNHNRGNGHYRPAPGHHRPIPGHNRGPVVIRPRPVPPVIIRPRPLPPTRSCQVVMTDRVNRVVRRYWGQSNGNGMCRDGLRQCNYDLQRMGMWGYRCATVRW